MAGETQVTVIGNLTADPDVTYTPSGAPVANFTVASTPRRFDRQANEWVDGETLFLRCSVWREAAENVVESLTKGTRVIVQGNLTQRSYETREGEKRTVVEMQVEEVGLSLRWTAAQPVASRERRERIRDDMSAVRQARQQARQQASADPWGGGEEPPF